MIITKLPFDYTTVSLSVERLRVRSPGIHLTDITKDMLITAGISRKTKGKPFSPEQQHLLFEQGFLWERMVAEYVESPENTMVEWDRFVGDKLGAQMDLDAASTSLVRPGELMLDGIAMTPDAVNMNHWHVEEWKATAMRSTYFDIQMKRPEWLWQAGAYGYYFKMQKAIFRIWHYAEMPPVVTQLVVEWTEEEVQQNWSNIMDHYRFMKERDR